MADRTLTRAQLIVLRAAARGDLYRSESGSDLYASYIRGEHRRVSAVIERLNASERLLAIGEREGFIRPWYLTDAGRAELAKHSEEC